MSDLIRREEVKDRVNSMLALFQVPKDLRKEALELFIDSIPSAEPKMKGETDEHNTERQSQNQILLESH